MNEALSDNRPHARRIGRSVLALFAGFVVAVVLSLGTDVGLHAAGIFPVLSEPNFSDRLLLLATAYRTLYSIVSSYVTARLAPYAPMQHALFGGFLGLILSTVGAVATWNRGLGPHWYPVALVALAMPTAWLGGAIRVRQLQAQAHA